MNKLESNVIDLSCARESQVLSHRIYLLEQAIAEVDGSAAPTHEKLRTKSDLLEQMAKLHQKRDAAQKREAGAEISKEDLDAAWQAIREDVDAWLAENDIYFVAEANRWALYEDGQWRFLCDQAVNTRYRSKLGDRNWRTVLQERMEEQGRLTTTMTYSVAPVPARTLNLFRYSPLQPAEGEPHWFFDTLVGSIGGGKAENVEHIEKLLVVKYRHPGDQTIPWLVLNDEGGTGKSLFGETILPTIFGANVAGQNLHIDDIIGRFNSQLEGLLVGLVNENPGDSYDHNKLKQVVGSRQIGFERKGLPRYFSDNFFWGVMASNNVTGTVQLADSDADRRFSIVAGKTPLRRIVADRLACTEDAAYDWIRTEGRAILTSPEECAKWLGTLLRKWPDVQSVRALHGEDYRALLDKQKGTDELVFEAVFNDPGFEYIRKPDLMDIYQANCRRTNQRYSKGRTNFYQACDRWLARNRPDISPAKVKWKEPGCSGGSSADVYVAGVVTARTLSSNTDTYFDTSFGNKRCRVDV